MAKRKKRVIASKKKKLDDSDENPGAEEAPSAKKVAASSTSFSEDDVSQNSSFSSIEMSKGAFGFSSHFWCNYCEFSADTKQELVTHMRQHMIKCSFCKYSSLSQADVTKHEKCEHGNDEVEVDSSSSSTDYNMDKDPCCACVFCDFKTYSTEYLEKHTTSKHKGMLPNSVATMISKSVSAKVRQADALFYAALSNERTETSHLEKEVMRNSESPSSSNVIVIEEENKNCKAVKPEVKDSLLLTKMSIKDEAQTPQVSSCVKLDPADERIAEKMASEISKTLSQQKTPSEWKVKVETMYCPCCPFSSVSIEKLKCHTFSQHVSGPAIARNNSCETAMDVPDVTFFCVKETCSHSSNTSSLYEEHLMSCCASHQTLPDEEIGRLRATLKFLLDFRKKHCLKTASGFLDFVSSINKVPVAEDVSVETVSGNMTDRILDRSSDTDNTTVSQKKLNYLPPATTLPVPDNQHYSRKMADSLHPLPNLVAQAGNQQAQLCVPTENNSNNQSVRGHLPNHPLHQNSEFSTSSNECGITYDNSFRFQSFATESQSNAFPQTHKPLYNQPISSVAHENNLSPVSNHLPIVSQPYNQSIFTPSSENAQRSLPNTFLNRESQFVEHAKERNFQNNCGALPLNSSTTHPQNLINTSSENACPPLSNNVSFMTSDQQKALFSPQFASTPQPLQQHQQLLTSSQNQSFQASTASNPPKMLDLLSDSYSILLDEELNLTPALDNPMTGDSSTQSGGPTVNENPASSNLLDVSVQQPMSSPMPSTVTVHSEIPYPPVEHIQQSTSLCSSSQQLVLQDMVPQQSLLSVNHHGQETGSFGNAMTTQTPSQEFMSLPVPSFPSPSFTHQYTGVQQTNHPNLQQSSSTASQYPSSSVSAASGPMGVSSSQVTALKTAQNQQGQSESVPFPVGQNSAAYNVPIPNAIPNSMQTSGDISHGQSFSPNVANPQSGMPSFLETSSGNVQSAQTWQGNQATDIPNFLVPTSQSSAHESDPNLADPSSFTNQEAQSEVPSHPNNDALSISNQVTPVKNQSMNFARNMVGNSPLSPSIYLNGQAPRHNRSNWTATDMMPRGNALPQIRPQVNAPARYTNPSNVRQNLFPPYPYRGRGRPRGSRILSRLPNPEVRPLDDDVIVTAVVRGPAPQQPQRQPIRGRGGVMRGQRLPLPRGPRMGGPGRGMMKNPSNTATPSPSKKPFDVSKHFVDLACVVNATNDDGEDEIQIMGVTPGHSANTPKVKAPPKVVDARKFSFCCVHCGRDQGSKQVMKHHMKANHNDSLLGAFRNVDTGQFLFFCPQLRCEFMTYDENRLTDHLFSCYNLDKSKQLPFDLQSALKNLRSLKIRKVNTNTNTGGSQTNPIDLDGQGLRDTFNNNLTDAFDDMVENTIGRHMTKPSSSYQPNANPLPLPPRGRSGPVRPQRGRPISNNLRMPRASYYQPRQAEMAIRSPGQGNVRMPPHQTYRMPGRRNFRRPVPRSIIPTRGGPIPQMTKTLRGRPPNPRPFMTNAALGNEDQPILIDIDSESTETATIPQSSAVSAGSQHGFSSEATLPPLEVTQNPSIHESDETEKAPIVDQSISGPYMEVEVLPSQSNNTTGMEQDQPNTEFAPEISSVSTLTTSSVDSQFVSASDSYNTTLHNEALPAENNEEEVNAILLEKVFAKVPHMPKKLSQRLVLRFKEFAAKRGVVITPNSKVIDEFVERISYKGSNPLSKQQQQPQHHQHSSSLEEPSNQTQQDTAADPQNKPSSECGKISSMQNESTSLHQSPPHASQNQSGVSKSQNLSDTFHVSNQSGGSGNQTVPSSLQSQTQSGVTENQTTDNCSLSQNHQDLSENESNSNSSQSHNQVSFSQSQNELEWKDKPDDNHSDDCDIVETKVILPPRDLKFTGGFADIAKSAINHYKATVKTELRQSSSSSSRSVSPLDVVSRINSSGPAENLQTSHACISSSIPTSVPASLSTLAGDDKSPSLALREQVTINEKLLKKELLPITYPMTCEGEAIVVQSSVDHLVSGNESLEVDIAGKPLDSNNLFKAETRNERTETADDLGKGLDGDGIGMGKLTKENSQESVIDKSSGRLILKVKKGDIPRRRNNSGTNVVTQVEEDRSTEAENGEMFVRRSERKRKIRPCEIDEDAMNELDKLISDDDDEYQVESEDESYDDDSDYERGHSSKKKSKTSKDPDAFDVSQKGPYVCWVCYKRFARCFGVKKHICQKHFKALCAITQAEAGDSDAHIQLVLFCPRNCKYVTSKLEAFSNHNATCQKGEILAEGQNFIEMQNAFILLEYVELQGQIASGAMIEMLKQKPQPACGRKRQRSMSQPETQKETDKVKGMTIPAEDPGACMMPSSSSE